MCPEVGMPYKSRKNVARSLALAATLPIVQPLVQLKSIMS